MGTFGSGLYGGGGSGATTATAGVPLGSGIIMPAYRIAGISQAPGLDANVDMYAEAIGELNRLLGLYNCDGRKIYSTSISDPFPLNQAQKIYTIGPGGDFDTDRPLFIRGANILFPTSPIVRRPVHILDDNEWRNVRVQDLPGAPPRQLYYDGGMDENGRGKIYLRFQPPAGYSLELYTWMRLRTSFASKDDVLIAPDGYELAIVYNLAKHLAALNPNEANMSPRAYDIAGSSLVTLVSLNTRSPRIQCDAGLDGGGGDSTSAYGWLDGGIQ